LDAQQEAPWNNGIQGTFGVDTRATPCYVLPGQMKPFVLQPHASLQWLRLPTADLEELHGAAHVLALDHLAGLCATKLAP
jgi:hypothetical protein